MGLSKDEAVKKIQESDSTEFNILTPDEEKTLLENHATAEVEKRIREEVKKIHSQYDDDIFEITGKRKAGDQKTYDFLKQTMKEMKEASASNADLLTKIKDLETKLKNGQGTEELKKEIASLKESYNNDRKEWENKYNNAISSAEGDKIMSVIERAAIGLRFKSEDVIPKDVRDIMIANAESKIAKSGKFVDGKLVFMKEDGTIMRNKNNGLEPYTPEELLKEELKSIIDIGRKQPGPDAGKKPELSEDGKDIFVPDAESAKTKAEVTEILLKQGLVRGSKEYDIAYAKYSKGKPLK